MNEQTIIGIIFSVCYVLLGIFICGYMFISSKQNKRCEGKTKMKVIKIDKDENRKIMCCDCKKNEALWLFETRKPFTEKETHYKPYCEKCAETFSKGIWKR